MKQSASPETNVNSARQKKNYPFYGIRMFSTMFLKTCHWSQSWAKWIQFICSQPFSFWSIVILFPHLRLDLPSYLFSSNFLMKILYAFLISSMCATFPQPIHPHLVKIANYEAPHCATFSCLPLLLPSEVQILYLASCFQTHSVYGQPRFHSRQYYTCVHFSIYIFWEETQRYKILTRRVANIFQI
jgi:hypothetical protein